MSGKNLVLLGLAVSGNRQPDIHETIAGLKAELARGEEVYTVAELEKLSRKLAEYETMLERLLSH
jgi:hypothetical protein